MRLTKSSLSPREYNPSKIPYFDERYGASLWKELAAWRANGEPLLEWDSVRLKCPKTTLYSKLNGGLRWLREMGTAEQQELVERVGLYKTPDERGFMLGYARKKAVDLVASVNSNATTPGPSDIPPSATRKIAEVEKLKGDVIQWFSRTSYDGVDKNKRPRFHRILSIDPDSKRELEELVDSTGSFMCDISVGYNGVFVAYAMSPVEIGLKNSGRTDS
jgi:hypothetical protein